MIMTQTPRPSDQTLDDGTVLLRAGQQAALDLLLVEMSALSTLMQGFAAANDHGKGQADIPESDKNTTDAGDVEQAFDNMPV